MKSKRDAEKKNKRGFILAYSFLEGGGMSQYPTYEEPFGSQGFSDQSYYDDCLDFYDSYYGSYYTY